MAREWPEELTADLEAILGLMCFQLAAAAHAYRNAGHDIARKAEAEQAFMLHRLIGFWFEHGENWRDAALDDLRKVRDAAAPRPGAAC